MNEQAYQKIVDILQEVLPDGWKKVLFYAAYMEGGYEMKYYADMGEGEFKECFSFQQFSKPQFLKTFMDIDKEISAGFVENHAKDKWNVLTLELAPDGYFKAYFDYKDINGSFIEYQEAWKKEYLR